MSCCRPSNCCTCEHEPRKMDACMCGCSYLNGQLAIFLALFFTLMGGLLSVGSLIDCSFATIDQTTFDMGDGLEIESIGVGFIFFQKTDGHCYWYNHASDGNTENKLQLYWDLLGKPWPYASILTLFCASFSWYFFLYSFSFCCSSQVKQIRYLIGFILAGVMTVCQACTFIVYGEDFCQRNNCSFSRGSATSLGAIACYVIAGLGYFFTSDYPGVKVLEKDYGDKPKLEEDCYEDENASH